MVLRAVVLVSTVQNPEEPLHCSECSLAREPENEIINDFDLIGVEAAVQLKEAGAIDEVVVFSLSPERGHLQKILAMGADRAIWGEADPHALNAEIVVNSAIQALGNAPDTLWITGKLGVNYEGHQTAQRLAQALGCPCLCSVYHIENNAGRWAVLCEDDAGIPHYSVSAPFVMTADLRLAVPRFPSLPNIIRAKKKPVAVISVDERDLCARHVQNSRDKRRQCQILSDMSDMINLIKGSL